MKTVNVSLEDRSYHIVIGRNILKGCGTLLRKLDIGQDAIVVTNKNLAKLYRKPLEIALEKSAFTTHFELVPDSEKAKSAPVATCLIDRISAYDRRRDIFIIAFGGGVIGDLAGFVAAIYKRGIPYVQFPTTLLAQVDSAIGGKVAIDLAIAKNLAGSFYQPRLVISDIELLKTLSARQLKNGLAEIIKYGVIKDRELFEFLEARYQKVLKRDELAEKYVVERSSRIKADIVSKDEFDKKGRRVILNYGHTIGHAVEAASGYSSRYNHGEAVAIGMVAAARIASSVGILRSRDADRIEALIKCVGLPTRIAHLEFSDIYESYLHDKKFTGKMNRLILPVRIGAVKVKENVPDRLIKDVLRRHFA